MRATLSISGCKPHTLTTTRKWRKYNKRKPCRFSNLPCASCPGRSRELYNNEKNATECNTMQQIFKKPSAGRTLASPSTPTHPVITQKLPPGQPVVPPCFSNLPCARCPGRSRELYDNEKNATECNTMQQIFKKSSAGRVLTFPSTPTHPVISLPRK